MKKYRIAPKEVKPVSTMKFRTKASAGVMNADSADFFDRTAERLRKDLSGNADVIMRELFIGGNENLDALLVYLTGNIDKNLFHWKTFSVRYSFLCFLFHIRKANSLYQEQSPLV